MATIVVSAALLFLALTVVALRNDARKRNREINHRRPADSLSDPHQFS
jgi:hypothetical protein